MVVVIHGVTAAAGNRAAVDGIIKTVDSLPAFFSEGCFALAPPTTQGEVRQQEAMGSCGRGKGVDDRRFGQRLRVLGEGGEPGSVEIIEVVVVAHTRKTAEPGPY